MKKALAEFKGLSHRFQDIAIINNVRYIDDSKATTVDACRAALISCQKPVVLIAGGRDKGSDFSRIKELIAEKVKATVLIGEAREKIRQALDGAVKIYDAGDMEEAVVISSDKADKGDIVLLSPMCASFDMYTDYKQRGEAFCQAVEKVKLKSQNSKCKTTA
jgi:UDP-N-acetylmuramoylalanine--D-glutamate ligase